MDAMDILGGLLGGGKSKSGSGSLGGKILKDLLGRRSGGAASSGQTTGSGRGAGRSVPAGVGSRSGRSGASLRSQAQELEDLLGVATGSSSRSGSSTGHRSQAEGTTAGFQGRDRTPMRRPPSFEEAGSRYRQPKQTRPSRGVEPPAVSNQDEVLVLVRAMINAAKADGRIGDDEQQAILARVADRSAETISFLRKEFAKPVDVREFAWSVPLGLEEKVYMMSLAAIDLDENREADYLRDLAHGLRLSPQECNELHQQLGAPTLY